MSFLNSFDISGYGMSAQRARVNIISENIANAQTTRTNEGGPYKRQSLIFKSIDFKDELNSYLNEKSVFLDYNNPLNENLNRIQNPIKTVVIDKIIRDDSSPKMKYEPKHPDSDINGYVAYPNINPVIEMADLVEATRSYQANIAAFESSKTLANNAISLLQ